MTTVNAYLTVDGASDALDFYRRAFDAEELYRLAMPDGRLGHAEMRIGDSIVMLCDDFPEFGSRGPLALGGSTVVIHLYVPDADAVWERAMAAGAKPLMPLGDAFWGDRYGQLVDPFGHRWAIATHLRDMTQEAVEAAMAKEMGSGRGNG